MAERGREKREREGRENRCEKRKKERERERGLELSSAVSTEFGRTTASSPTRTTKLRSGVAALRPSLVLFKLVSVSDNFINSSSLVVSSGSLSKAGNSIRSLHTRDVLNDLTIKVRVLGLILVTVTTDRLTGRSGGRVELSGSEVTFLWGREEEEKETWTGR